MRNQIDKFVKWALCFAVFGSICCVTANAQEKNKQIDAIRTTCTDISRKVDAAQKTEFSDIFVIELAVNRALNPYPAVGIYSNRTRLFYTYGDREKNPYPDRLIRATEQIKRSARTEDLDMCFNDRGQLIFAFLRDDGGDIKETRVYFADGKLIRMTHDRKEVVLKSQAAVEAESLALLEAARLKTIFSESLREVDN